MKETGFGTMKACQAVLQSLKKRFEDVSISLCKSETDLKKVLSLCPDIVFLAVKYVQSASDKKIWLTKYFEDAGMNLLVQKEKL